MTVEKLVGSSAEREDDGLKLLFRPLGSAGDYELELRLTPAAVKSATAADVDFQQPVAPVILARYDADEQTLTTFPTVTNFGKHFLQPKYRDITTIVLEEVLPLGDAESVRSIYYEELDKGLIREPLAGFGVNYDMRFIIEAVERQVGIDTFRLCHEPGVQRYGDILSMAYSLFRKLRRDINRTHKHAIDLVNKAKAEYLDATLNTILYPEYVLPEGDGTRRPVADILAETLIGKSRTPAAEAKAAARTVKKSVKTLAHTEPAELLDLRREIELVSLEELIELFEKKLGQGLQERHWQTFFKENSFILQLAFNLPALAFGDQVAVGGTRFDGSGGKFADYAVKLGLLGNLALIEIKTPKAPLLEKKEYRGGIHAPSAELVGAVTQVSSTACCLVKSVLVLASGNWLRSSTSARLPLKGYLPEQMLRLATMPNLRS